MGDVVMEDQPDNVVELNDHRPMPIETVKTKDERRVGCQHYQVFVCEDSREVTCQVCDAVIDPVNALLGMTRSWDLTLARLRSMRAERGRLAKEIEELKRQRRNLKAQIRRAVQK